MNHVYRLVFNASLNAWVAAPETAKARRKGGARGGLKRTAVTAAVLLSTMAGTAYALPTGGQVSAGSGTIAQSGNSMTVSQSSQNLALNWSTFNIAAPETVRFVQPNASSIALNRVLGSEASAIYGKLSANGQVFLLNPNGILFGKTAQVSVGALVASTLGLSDTDFLSGHYHFTGTAGSIVNQGTLTTADRGYLALLGGQVSNQGTLTARLGTVALAAGTDITVDFAGDGLLSVQVNQGAVSALAENKQLIQAEGGTVLLTAQAADSLVSAVVNNEGVIEARAAESHNGIIRLTGDTTAGLAFNTGTLDATEVDASARSVLQTGTVRADEATLTATYALIQTQSGDIQASHLRLDGGEHTFLSGSLAGSDDLTVAGQSITLAAATLSTGDGGRLRIGGGAHGQDADITDAQTVSINGASTLTAGNDAHVVVWSDTTTNDFGKITTGAGSFVEVSSKGTLNLGGTVSTGASSQILYDPANIVIDATAPASFYLDLADPTPTAGDQHGSGGVTALATGNLVVVSPSDSFGAPQAGAVYLYNGRTGALISTLTGSQASDQVGSNGVTALTNGNYVVASANFSAIGAGAVTWGSGTTGVTGVVSRSNSLAGIQIGDNVGINGVTALTNGNYVVASANWANGAATGAGAVTWGSGTTGVRGAVSRSNSLVGSQTGDNVGINGITALTNGNYVVVSPNWANGTAQQAGAVTWGSGRTGISGAVSSSNSLIGSQTGELGGVTFLTNGNYVVVSPNWANGTAQQAGAVTWGSGTTGVTGAISSSNSLVGSKTNDHVGNNGVTFLTNGNYVVDSPNWANGTAQQAGAVTWGSGSTGISGAVSSSNSLVGSKTNDTVGANGITALTNGNYVVDSYNWANGTATGAGAVTWGSGSTGISGAVSSSNSLVGSRQNSNVGRKGVTALTNGNYVVASPFWANGTVVSAGAVTWGNGSTGISGAVSSSNSLVGSQTNDIVGIGGVTALTNGNYVVDSFNWANGTVSVAGAVTWGSGSTGISGAVSSSNSLVGSQTNDAVGIRVTALTNGNYVVTSYNWDNGTATRAGAVTWGSGSTGTSGAVSSSNSLVGSQTNDSVGNNGVTALTNGNYVVDSYTWANGTATGAGAVTWGSGSTGISGAVSSSNSLVGSQTNDLVGRFGITALTNGNYVVDSGNWANGTATGAGAVTWGSGSTGISGAVSSSNSLVGSQTNDFVGNGGLFALTNGNYVVRSSNWASGTASNAGAVTWGSGSTGISGAVSSSNSLVGSQTGDLGGVTFLTNGNYVVVSPNWANGTAQQAGAVTWGSGTTGVTGAISSSNSLVGSQTNDHVGNNGVTFLTNGNYVVDSPNWANGTAQQAGAVTWGSGSTGISGAVSSSNSLVGSQANDNVGNGGVTALTNGNYVVDSPNWNGNSGAVWLVADPSNLGTLANASAADVTLSPTALAAAGAGSTVTLQATHNITVNSPVSIAGKLDLIAGNTVTLNAGLSSTDTGDALVLSGTNFVNNAGATALSTPNGRWLVYSANPAGDTFGGLLSGNTAVWDATYTANAPATLAAGDHYVFAEQPTVTVTANAISKIYDGTAAFSTPTYTGGLVNAASYGNVFTQDVLSGTLAIPTATRNVGSYAITKGTLAAPTGYLVSYNGADASITPRTLTVSYSGVSKTYDGTTATTVTTSDDHVTGDVLTVLDNAAFTDKNAGTHKTVNVSGVSLSGTDAGNYTLAGTTASTTASITPRTLTVSYSGVSKTYDGTTATTVTTSDDHVTGDVLTVLDNAAFTDKNAGTHKTVNVSGVSLSGTDAGNYSVATTGSATASITPRTLTVSYSGVSKTYDGTTATTVTTSDDHVTGDVLTVLDNAAFTDKNAGTHKTVNVSGVSLSGTDAGNYSVATIGSATASITPRTLTVSYSGVSKTYDGTTATTVTTSDDHVTGDVLTVLDNAAFTDKNASPGKTVNVSGVSLSGTDAGNYTLAGTTASTTASITPRTLTVSYSGVSKTYDGTTATTVTTSDDHVTGDVLTVLDNAAFTDKNADTGKTVNVSGVSLSGTDAGNYTLAGTTASTTASITPRTLTVSYSGVSKTYDGTTATTVTTSDDHVTGDVLTVLDNAAFTDKNASPGKTVNVSGVSLSGTDAGNYSVATTGSATANITPRTLTVSYSGVSKTYDGTTATTVTTGDDHVTGDVLTVLDNAAFTDKNADTGKTVNVSGVSLSGTDAGNYTVATTGSATANITPRTLTVSYSGVNRTYDGTIATTVTTSDDHVTGDVLTVLDNAAFTDKNAHTGKTVNVSGVSLSGTDAGNYTLAGTTASTTASITPRTLTVSYSGVSKTYDGTTATTVTTSDDHVTGDVLTVLDNAAFTDKNASPGKTVNVSGVSLSGTDAGNYSVATTGSATANITPRTLTVSYSGVNRTYDGTTAATVTTSDNRVTGDVLTVLDNAAFTDKNADTGKTVNVSGVSLSGTDAGNYTLAGTTASTTASITPRTLTVSYSGVSKTYDGTTATTVTTSDDHVTGDVLTVLDNAAFTDKNASPGKTVNVSGVSLSGTDAGNYTLAGTTASTTASITPRTLTVSYSGVSKTYDGTTATTVTTSDDHVTGDVLTVLDNAAFTDKNADTGKTVNVSGVSLSGTDVGNYTVATTGSATANITPRTLTVSYSGVNRTYDGTTAATVATSDNRLTGDALTVLDNAAFTDKNAGTGKTVNVSGVSLSGTDAGNYTLAGTTANTTASITPRTLTVSYSGVSKTYDGTTATTVTTSDNRVTGDVLALTDNAAFTDKNAGTNKTVNVSGVSLSGTDAGNYSLAGTTASTAASITPKDLSLVNLTADNKVYDGTITAAATAGLTGVVTGETVTDTLTARFADSNTGLAKTVTVTGIALGGADSGNYSITPGETTQANITSDPRINTIPLEAVLASLEAPSHSSAENLDTITASSQDNIISVVGTGIHLPEGVSANE